MPGVNCPRCGSDNRAHARYCSVCGTGLQPGVPAPQPAIPDEQTGKPPTSGLENQATSLLPAQDIPKITNYAEELVETATSVVLLGRYRILSELGRGGYGAVYRAWDIHLNKAVAIKENLDSTPDAQRQFSREASILAHLSHPNLVRVTDHFAMPGEGQYLVMDFVEGEDIETLIKRQGAIPLDHALGWCYQVIDALDYLHSRRPQVLHRDIKPANIRITPDGRALLVDFGLVKINIPEVPTTHGARGVSPGYAPPEQYGKGKTDGRSDIYSLSATLYHMVTGQKPVESVLRSPERQITPAHILASLIPVSISMAIQIGMAIEPDQRFQSVSDFRGALLSELPSRNEPVLATQMLEESAITPEPVVDKPVLPATPLQKPKIKAHFWRFTLIIIAGIIAFGLISLFVAGLSYYQMRISVQATYDANVQASAVEVVNATHTAHVILRSQVTPSP